MYGVHIYVDVSWENPLFYTEFKEKKQLKFTECVCEPS